MRSHDPDGGVVMVIVVCVEVTGWAVIVRGMIDLSLASLKGRGGEKEGGNK